MVAQKGLDDGNLYFDKMFKETTNRHYDMAHMLHDFESTAKMESDEQ